MFILPQSLLVDCLKLQMFLNAASKIGSLLCRFAKFCFANSSIGPDCDQLCDSLNLLTVLSILIAANNANSISEAVCGYFSDILFKILEILFVCLEISRRKLYILFEIIKLHLYSLQQSMPSKTSCDLLNFFRQIVQTQNAILIAKRQLNKCKNFDPSALFERIAGNSDAISIESLKKYIQHKIACSERELYTIFQKFDHSRLGYLIKQDFTNQLTITGKHNKKGKSSTVTHQIQLKFLALLSTINKAESVLQVWRQDLQHLKPFIFFQGINRSKTGVISPKQLSQYFFYNNQRLNFHEVEVLHRGLLRRAQKELNLQVFCLNFSPLQFGYYTNYQTQLKHGIEVQLKNKNMLARQAQQLQQQLQKKRRNSLLLTEVHKQAALSRELQLQKKIKDEIRAYQQLKFLTKKKFHPHLSYDYFLQKQKENQLANVLFVQTEIQKAKIREDIYRGKIRNVESLIEVERFQSGKNNLQTAAARISEQKNIESLKKLKLEKQIKSHAFSNHILQNLLLKRRVQQDLAQQSYKKSKLL